MLSIQKLSFNIAGKNILDSVDMNIGTKQHIGFVGRNGSGKSTLFNLILHKYESDSGKIELESGCKIVTIKQDMPSGDFTPREFLLSQDEERNSLMCELDTCTDTHRMSDIYDRLLQINAFDAESRAAIVLKGLGFDEEAQTRKLSSFSGGFRMRVALGSALFQEPDLLLLDEPTNHLDIETAEWLCDFLKRYPKSFLCISHDRDFLNDTVDYIVHLKNKKITKYTGNFDTFLNIYTKKQKNAEEFNAKMEEKRKHMMDFVKRFHAKATKAKQAQSRLKAIEKLNFLPLESDDPTVKFNFPEPDNISPQILNYENISLAYGDNLILRNVSGCIMNDDRIAIVGANGNGKTTFAKFLAGQLKQKKGVREANTKLKIAFYRQDLFEQLNPNSNAFNHIKEFLHNFSEQQIRSYLGRFGFSGDMVYQNIQELSGGEKTRLVFAALTIDAPHLLILDEPTNNLDLEMRESLISTLTAYNGAIILITHDRHFLNRVANSILIIKDKTITQFNGDLARYEQDVLNLRTK